MLRTTDVAIVGAGPYGLSIAAHLSQLGVPFRIFGKPMDSWLTQMPRGMLLKSEGFASSVYHPEGSLTLGQYCREKRLPYADIGTPVPLETFCEYGLAFQRQFVPTLEAKIGGRHRPRPVRLHGETGQRRDGRSAPRCRGRRNFSFQLRTILNRESSAKVRLAQLPACGSRGVQRQRCGGSGRWSVGRRCRRPAA